MLPSGKGRAPYITEALSCSRPRVLPVELQSVCLLICLQQAHVHAVSHAVRLLGP